MNNKSRMHVGLVYAANQDFGVYAQDDNKHIVVQRLHAKGIWEKNNNYLDVNVQKRNRSGDWVTDENEGSWIDDGWLNESGDFPW